MTGAGGQVGRALARVGPAEGAEVIGLGRAALDITDPEAVRAALARVRPDAVVNAAAYTAVDRAEAEPDAAFRVNRDGASVVAEAAAAAAVPLVHLSTDYVFDGTKGAPYRPDDPPSPLNVYGASKAAGEAAVRAAGGRAAVLRTAWVFGGGGEDFVSKILRLAADRDRLTVVADQWGHPTPADDVARAALSAAAWCQAGGRGTLHVGGLPLTTWHGLATVAVAVYGEVGAVPVPPVDPVPTSAFPRAARRPARVELALAGSLERLGWRDAPDWRRAVSLIVGGASQSGAVDDSGTGPLA